MHVCSKFNDKHFAKQQRNNIVAIFFCESITGNLNGHYGLLITHFQANDNCILYRSSSYLVCLQARCACM